MPTRPKRSADFAQRAKRATFRRATPSALTSFIGVVSRRHDRAVRAMRVSMRRFTRLNAFSKKLDNHKAAVAFYAMWYNFARIHQTLRVTPAMEAGISDHVWDAEEIARL